MYCLTVSTIVETSAMAPLPVSVRRAKTQEMLNKFIKACQITSL